MVQIDRDLAFLKIVNIKKVVLEEKGKKSRVFQKLNHSSVESFSRKGKQQHFEAKT